MRAHVPIGPQAARVTERVDLQLLRSLQRITDAALAYLTEEELLQELLQRISEILAVDTVAILLLERRHAARPRRQGHRGGGRAGRPDPARPRLRRAHRRRAPGGHDPRRRPRRHPQPDPAREGHQAPCSASRCSSRAASSASCTSARSPPASSPTTTATCSSSPADRAALAIEQARSTRERGARGAERAHRRCESLQRVTDAALAYLTEEDLLQELLQRISEILAVDTVAILLLEGDGCTPAPPRASRRRSSRASAIPLGRGFAGRIAAERRADHDRRRRPRRHPQPDPAREGHPLPARRPAARRGPRHRRPARRHASPRASSPTTTATSSSSPPTAPRSRIEQARALRAAPASPRRCSGGCCPPSSPTAPGSRSPPATCPPPAASLGGDWYDVFALAGGRIGVAVGDVVGHGVAAAAVMAQLRTAVRAYAADGPRAGRGGRPRQHADVAASARWR